MTYYILFHKKFTSRFLFYCLINFKPIMILITIKAEQFFVVTFSKKNIIFRIYINIFFFKFVLFFSIFIDSCFLILDSWFISINTINMVFFLHHKCCLIRFSQVSMCTWCAIPWAAIDSKMKLIWMWFLKFKVFDLSLIHIWRCRRYAVCRSRWSPYH